MCENNFHYFINSVWLNACRWRTWRCLLLGPYHPWHRQAYTFIVDLAISIAIGEFDHLFDFLVGQVLSEIKHGGFELMLVDDSVTVDVEDAERLPHLLHLVGAAAVLAGVTLHPVYMVLRPRHHA